MVLSFLVYATQGTASLFGEMSRLRRVPSTLATLSYLYQGFPDLVMGVEFQYSDHSRQKKEDLLEKLLSDGSEKMRPLRDAACFLASRTYLDKKGRIILLLSRLDAYEQITQIGFLDPTTQNQPKVREVSHLLKTYFYAGLDFSKSQASMKELTKNSSPSLTREIQIRLKTIRVATKIEENWAKPRQSRQKMFLLINLQADFYERKP